MLCVVLVYFRLPPQRAGFAKFAAVSIVYEYGGSEVYEPLEGFNDEAQAVLMGDDVV